MRFEMERSRSNVDVAEEFEGNELIAVLRECIDELPDVERTVLACSYCTSMSQQEIAEVVGISQQTVSNKIQRAIERLRLDLTKAGVAAVVPLLSRGTVFEAMTTGHACPPGIMEGIALRIESYEKAARTLSRRAVANTGRSAWLISAAVVIAIGAVLGVTWFRQPNQIATIAPPPEKATVVPSPAPTHVPFSRTWNFNTRDQADDFKVLEGSWHHISDGGPAGEGCMESDGDFFVASPVPLVVSSAKLPIRITYRERVVLPGTSTGWMSTFAWSDSDYRWKANFHNLGKINSVDPTGPAWNEIRTYISDSFMASWTNGELQLFSAFELKGNSRLGLAMCMLGRHRIYDLTIQEIAAAEIPDVRSYLAALEKIEPSKRVGRVIVPELQSNHPQDPVFIGFDDLTKVPETRTSRP
jgi:hypothetical protein